MAVQSSTELAEDDRENGIPSTVTTDPPLRGPTFGGPSRVARELEDQAVPKTYRFEMLQRLLEPWFDWKRRLSEEHGLTLGFNATLLGQYGDGALDKRDIAGGARRTRCS